jgi:hypothetical protein
MLSDVLLRTSRCSTHRSLLKFFVLVLVLDFSLSSTRTTTDDEDDLAAAPPRLGDQRLFFGFSIFPLCFATKDFTRAYSLFTPLPKSRGPYSNSTTKLKVKTMNRTNQKHPRRSAMQQGSCLKPCDQWHCYGHAPLFAREDATIYPEISGEAQPAYDKRRR